MCGSRIRSVLTYRSPLLRHARTRRGYYFPSALSRAPFYPSSMNHGSFARNVPGRVSVHGGRCRRARFNGGFRKNRSNGTARRHAESRLRIIRSGSRPRLLSLLSKPAAAATTDGSSKFLLLSARSLSDSSRRSEDRSARASDVRRSSATLLPLSTSARAL